MGRGTGMCRGVQLIPTHGKPGITKGKLQQHQTCSDIKTLRNEDHLRNMDKAFLLEIQRKVLPNRCLHPHIQSDAGGKVNILE